MNMLLDPNFWVVALGTMLLGLSSGMVGSISVLRGQSLIGDAIGHASFPGVVLAFMLVLTRDPSVLMLGAFGTGVLAFVLIQLFDRYSKTTLDTALAIVLSSLFGLGMVLKSYIQGHPDYKHASQAGLQTYIFGQAAYLGRGDLRAIFIVSGIALLLLLLFYKEIKLFVFDTEYAYISGLRPSLLHALSLVLTLMLIVVGLRVVGAILIASMLISPTVTAQQWTCRYGRTLLIAGGSGLLSAFLGTWWSGAVKGVSTGPAIIVCMAVFALVSMLIGPRGVIRSRARRKEKKGGVRA